MNNAIRTLREMGLSVFLVSLVRKLRLPIPFSPIFVWKSGKRSEFRFWDDWFRTKGLRWPNAYIDRLDPDLQLEERIAALLPAKGSVSILDVGSGPLTSLGKKYPGKKIEITAVDPLADEYDLLLKRYSIFPIVRTRKAFAERLTGMFAENQFDLVYSCNAIDHTYNPEKSISEMLAVVKENGFVVLEHAINEGENMEYTGFHQWNFSLDSNGNFLIRSRKTIIDFNQKYGANYTITNTISGKTLFTTILKMNPLNRQNKLNAESVD